MRSWIMAAACAALCTGTAHAATVFSDTFTGENSGNSGLYYTAFANFTVTSGNVDLIRSGDFSIACVGGSGSCVDLDGDQAGTLTSRNSFAYNAGDVVTLSAQFSGNQRVVVDNSFFLSLVDQSNTTLGSNQGTLAYNAGFATYTASFTALTGGRVFARLGSTTSGAYGAILDNVSLDVSAGAVAVPEPATWAMMVLGLGMAGYGLRRRKVTARVAFG